MNKEFEQWLNTYHPVGSITALKECYNHLQANPHLLREDAKPIKIFKVSQIRDLLNQVYNEKITFSRFVEILNENAVKNKPYDYEP